MAETDLAARVSFVSTLESGYARTIRKGSVFAADHPVVVANPTRFGPVNVRERPGTAASAALQQAATRPQPVTDEPPTVEEQIADLARAHRDELETLARAAGVEKPEDLPNKDAVARAIIEAVAAEPDPPIVGGLEDGAGRPADEPLNGEPGSGAAGDEILGSPAPETPLSTDAGAGAATGAKAGSPKGAGAATGAKAGSSSK